MNNTRNLFESFQRNLNESNFEIKYDGDSDKITKANYMLDNLYDYYRKYKSTQEFIKTICSIINNKEDFLRLAYYVTDEKDLLNKSFEEILNQMINTHNYDTYIMFSDLAKVVDYDKLLNWYEVEDESDDGKLYESNLDESKEVNDMTMEEMIDEYSNICEDAGLSIKEAVQQLNGYDCLNTGSFRNALDELREYLNS